MYGRQSKKRKGKMVSRRTAYWINSVSTPYKLFCRLGWDAVRGSLIVQNGLDQIGPITVSNCTLRRDLDDTFLQTTRAALKMIECHDPRRFRVIEQEFRLIVNQPLQVAAAYEHSTRQCKVNFTKYWVDEEGRFCADPQVEHYEWFLARYASMLVHESVHGRLSSLYFVYTEKTRTQIERICVTEQRRFLARLPQDKYDFESLVPAFDPQRWEALWNMSSGERFKRIMQSLWERGPSS